MKNLLPVILALQCLIALSRSDDPMKSSEVRSKRSVWQFGRVVQCAFSRRSLFPQVGTVYDFNGYGCWCGKGGSGRPVDSIDRCCQAHDYCYDNLVASSGQTVEAIKGTRYEYTCRPLRCGESGGKWWIRALCECDKTAAECFVANAGAYDRSMKTAKKRGRC